MISLEDVADLNKGPTGAASRPIHDSLPGKIDITAAAVSHDLRRQNAGRSRNAMNDRRDAGKGGYLFGPLLPDASQCSIARPYGLVRYTALLSDVCDILLPALPLCGHMCGALLPAKLHNVDDNDIAFLLGRERMARLGPLKRSHSALHALDAPRFEVL